MKKCDAAISGKPIIAKDSVGNISGGGAHVNVSTSHGSVGAGGFSSGQTKSFWASAEKPIGDSSSIGVSAEVSNNGYRHAGVSFKTSF